MNTNLLPVGSIIKTKKGKLVMIIGYYPGGPKGSMNLPEYAVTPYPFNYINLSSNCGRIFKNYDWFYATVTYYLFESDIHEIIFEGYKNEYYYKFIETINKK